MERAGLPWRARHGAKRCVVLAIRSGYVRLLYGAANRGTFSPRARTTLKKKGPNNYNFTFTTLRQGEPVNSTERKRRQYKSK